MAHQQSDEHYDFGAVGSTDAFQYWNDLISVTVNIWEQQMMRAVGVWQDLVLGNAGPGPVVPDIAAFWQGWFTSIMALAAFPWEWTVRRLMSVPTLVFIVDDTAQTTTPQSAVTPVNAAHLEVRSTALQRIHGHAQLGADHVEVRLTERGNRVQVKLVNLGNKASSSGNKLPHGLYVGVVYASEGGPVRRPLALVYMLVNDDDMPPQTQG